MSSNYMNKIATMTKNYFLFFIFYLLLTSCTEDNGSSSEPPQRPVMVGKTVESDTSDYEIMGIDALDGPENGIRIIWEEHPQRSELDYFNIFRSEDPQGLINYELHARVEPDGVFLFDSIYHTFSDLNQVEEEQAYYYYVTAVNEDGTESLPSDTVWYTLVQKARLTAPLGMIYNNPEQVEFNWVFEEMPLPNGYILRIEEDFTDLLVYTEWVEPMEDYDQSYRNHPLSGEDLQKFVISGIQYRWRIDCVEKDPVHFGSESNWGTFKINWGK